MDIVEAILLQLVKTGIRRTVTMNNMAFFFISIIHLFCERHLLGSETVGAFTSFFGMLVLECRHTTKPEEMWRGCLVATLLYYVGQLPVKVFTNEAINIPQTYLMQIDSFFPGGWSLLTISINTFRRYVMFTIWFWRK